MNKTKIALRLLLTWLFLILFYSNLTGQAVYTNVEDQIYNFLDRQNIQGNIALNSEMRPFTRKYIAQKLSKIFKIKHKLTETESNELEWFLREYKNEMKKDKEYKLLKGKKIEERLSLYSYSDSLFSLHFSPIAGYEFTRTGNVSGYKTSIGINTYLYYSDWFGGKLNMSDHQEKGDNIDKYKQLTPERGRDFVGSTNGYDWSDVRSQLNLLSDWAAVSFNKDYQKWGNSYFGNLILSDKAPSYPNIRIELKPVEWFRFYYTFGWIHSGIIDSNSIIVFNNKLGDEGSFEQFIPKYHIANMMTFTPWPVFDFSIGNSFIYAGNFRPEMLLPFNFYKYMDRDTGKKSSQDGNGQLFFDLALRYPINFKFYSTLFLDVASIQEIVSSKFEYTWLGFTFGVKGVNVLINNLDVTLEYTRVNPWVYEHKIPLTDYKHLNFVMGHWIGQNADNLKVVFDYQVFRGLKFQMNFEYFRKGGLRDISYAYEDNEVDPFLYGPVRKDFNCDFSASYEPIHELNLYANFKYSRIQDEDETRTKPYLLGQNNSFTLGFMYGLP